MTFRANLMLSAAAALLLSSCGEESAEAGGNSAQSLKEELRAAMDDVRNEDFEAALKKLDAVADSAEADATLRFRARRDAVVPRSVVEGADGFQAAIDALMDHHESQVSPHDLAKICLDLSENKLFELAGTVILVADGLVDGVQDAAERADLKSQFKLVAKRVEESGQGGATTDQLRALGYLGD